MTSELLHIFMEYVQYLIQGPNSSLNFRYLVKNPGPETSMVSSLSLLFALSLVFFVSHEIHLFFA